MARPAAARGRAAATGSRSRVSGRGGDDERRRGGLEDEDDEEGRPGQASPGGGAAATGWTGAAAATGRERVGGAVKSESERRGQNLGRGHNG